MTKRTIRKHARDLRYFTAQQNENTHPSLSKAAKQAFILLLKNNASHSADTLILLTRKLTIANGGKNSVPQQRQSIISN